MLARIITCGCLAVALLLTSSAAASAALFEGGADGDSRVSVSFERRAGKILDFTIERARFFCTDGDRFRAGTRTGPMKVRKRGRFKGQFTSQKGSVLVDVSGYARRGVARGEFRMVTVFPGVKCGTRNVPWSAQRL